MNGLNEYKSNRLHNALKWQNDTEKNLQKNDLRDQKPALYAMLIISASLRILFHTDCFAFIPVTFNRLLSFSPHCIKKIIHHHFTIVAA